MSRSRKLILLFGTALALIAGCGFMAWNQWRTQRTFYSDGESIRQPVNRAIVRDVLWRPPTLLPVTINTDADEREGRLSADGLMLFFVRGKPGENTDIYVSLRMSETQSGQQWSEPEPLSTINTVDDELGPELSRGGRSLLFYSNRAGGAGGYDLWVSLRDEHGFQPPINLGPAINSEFDETNPALSPEGDRLVFASNRPRLGEPSSRDLNLYESEIGPDAGFAQAVALDDLNTAANDAGPAFSPAGDFLYFSSIRKTENAFGGFDLYRARVVQGEFQPPVNLGPEVNTASNERDPSPSLDGFGLHFSSERVPISANGGAGAPPQSDLYYTTSREVFREVEPAQAINWASIAALLLPAMIWALIGSLAIVALLMMLRRARSGQMSLLARCLVASLAAHLALLIMLTFWQVTTSIVNVLEHEGSMQVAITSTSAGSGDELFTQVRGGLTSIELSAEAGSTARSQTEVPREETSGSVELDVHSTQLTFNDQQPARSEVRDAPATLQLPPEIQKPETPDAAMTAQVVTPQAAPPALDREKALTAQAAELAPTNRDRRNDAIPSSTVERSPVVSMPPVSDPSKNSDGRSVNAMMQAADANIARPPTLTPPTLNDAPTMSQAQKQIALANPPTEARQTGSEASSTMASRASEVPRSANASAINVAQANSSAIRVAPQAVASDSHSTSMAGAISERTTSDAGIPASRSVSQLPTVAMNGSSDAAVAVPADQRLPAAAGDATVVLQVFGSSAPRTSGASGAGAIAAGPVRESQVQLVPQRTQTTSNEPTMAATGAEQISDSSIERTTAMARGSSESDSVGIHPTAVATTQLSIPAEQSGGRGSDAAVVLQSANQSSPRAAVGPGVGSALNTGSPRDAQVQMAPQQSTSNPKEGTMAAAGSALTSEATVEKPAVSSGAVMGSSIGDVRQIAVSGANLATPKEFGGRSAINSEPAVGFAGAVATTGAARRADQTGTAIAVRSGNEHLTPATMLDTVAATGTETGIGMSSAGAREADVPERARNGKLASISITEIGSPALASLSLPKGDETPHRDEGTSGASVVLAAASPSTKRAETASSTSASAGASPSSIHLDPARSAASGEERSQLPQTQRVRDGEESAPSRAAGSIPTATSGPINLPAVAMTNVATPAEQPGGRGTQAEARGKLPTAQASTSNGNAGSSGRAVVAANPGGVNSKSAHLAPERGGDTRNEPWILMTDQRIKDAPQSTGSDTSGTGSPHQSNLSAPSMVALAPDLHIPREVAPVPSPYVQRSEDLRKKVVKQMGGSEATEKAVALALKWFANHQSPDGRWAARSFDSGCDKCGGSAKFDTDVAATALALLCFLAADHTHVKEGPYQMNVARALAWLKTQQKDDGDFRGGETMYSHGIATIAIAEAYGMTNDHDLGMLIKKSIDYIAAALNTRVGGWRYEPGQAGDTSVLGWQIMAMTSARRAGIPVPDELYKAAADWMNVVDTPGSPGLYSYQPGQRFSASMTAEGMFVQQLAGRDHNDPRMRASAEFIMQNPPRWSNDPNTYYWYYATLALFQHQGNAWTTWNKNLTEVLLANQEKSGAAAGSWDPLDNWSKIGGRVYQTAMCTLCLEVYYRYLPMYAAVEREDEKGEGGD